MCLTQTLRVYLEYLFHIACKPGIIVSCNIVLSCFEYVQHVSH